MKMKSIICNISVTEVDVNCNALPSLLIVKLKHKSEYKIHVIFEVVRPALVV